MPTLSNPQRLLLALLFLAVAALNTGSSGGIRFGGDEDDGSGFGGTGRAPTGGSGLGGTGLKPFLGDAGEVRIQFEPDAIVIAEQVAEEEIKRILEASEVLPPVTVVTAAEFAAQHPAEVSITDSIQQQLRRDAVIYERILESVEGYYPAEVGRTSPRMSAPERAPEPRATKDARRVEAMEVAAAVPAASAPASSSGAAMAADSVAADAGVPSSTSDPARITWAELASYLAENGTAGEADDTPATKTAENPAAIERPDRIRRPELPQVQRGRIIQRPAILPPRVQPMRF